MAAQWRASAVQDARDWSDDRLEQAGRWLDQRIGGGRRRKPILLLGCVLAVQAADLGTTGAVATKLARGQQPVAQRSR